MARKREELTVRITYEPNRFATDHLLSTYELLAPDTHVRPMSQNSLDLHKTQIENKNENDQ